MAGRLNDDAVRHVAQLARLRVTDDEVRLYANQLAKVLDYMEQLNELDTGDVPPMAHAVPLTNVLREDVVRESWPAEAALANAPQKQDGFFRLPKVLDQPAG